ncbi:hypothetical protein [Streptomyces sp. 2P-4]|uniref:hypothetical protein n=1 Tax=Streptomyces sp. 2P-4 TaxID=2931974 RepID=UPI00253FF762|nr:hypothetical protein [Streptomyces sp. 2P-4]
MEHAQTSPDPRDEGNTAQAPPARPARRGRRTALLIAGAAALGILGGTVAGYAVQYHRPPTPLPPLAQQKLVTPKALAPDAATTRDSINANRRHKTDGDLTALLVEAPAGAKVLGRGYETLDVFSLQFEEPDKALGGFAEDGVRRIAATGWVQDDRVFVDIRLIQFRDRVGADAYQQAQASVMPTREYAGNPGVPIPGAHADLAHVWVNSRAETEPGYHPVRGARAVARRGDIVMEIDYFDNRGRIAEGDVVDLAKRQLERM